MERNDSFFRRRLLTRRALPYLAWLGLFVGGGWGVYHYGAAPEDSTPNPMKSESESDTAATEQIKQLFATHPAKAPSAPANDDRYANDRYAPPPLPPLEQPTDEQIGRQEKTETPRSAAEVADDRYGAVGAGAPNAREEERVVDAGATSDSVEPTVAHETPADRAVDASLTGTSAANGARLATNEASPATAGQREPEVTRGQEPDGGNPLRHGSQDIGSQLGSPDQARAAFGHDRSGSDALTTAAVPRQVDEQTDALRTARPLPGAADRYGAPAPPVVPPLPSRAAPGGREPTAQGKLAGPSGQAPGAFLPTPTSSGEPTPAYINSRSAPSVASSPSAATMTEPPAARGVDQGAAGRRGITPTPGLTGAMGQGRPGERLLEGPQSPAITIQKLAPPEIQVGKKCTFAIRVTNNGQRAAQRVVVQDEVPMGTQLIGTAPRASVSGAQVQWDLGTLSVGEERIVEMELIPTEEGELGSVAVVTFAAHASAKARCTKPELQLQLTSKPRVMAGEKHMIQIEVSNPGSGDATNVMLLETLPAGVSHAAGAALEFEVGTLRAGESRKIDLILNAEQAGVIENIMTARADANLQTTASCQFEIVAPALAVKVEGPARKYLERPATFVVNVNNPGTATAKDLQLVAQLPKGLQFVNANNLGEYDQATHSVYWSLAELPANEDGTVQLTALPIAPGDHTIRAASKARQGLEARDERSLHVEGMAALSFETRALENLIEIGGETTCEIRVTNRGSKAASNVQVTATMPAGLRAVTAKGDSQHSLQANQVAFSPMQQLAPGAEAIFHVTAQGVAPGDQRVEIRVTSDDEQPIIKQASARVYSDQ